MNEETPKVSPDDLEERNGLTYKKLTDVPFTGLVEQKWNNGQLRIKVPYKDGKKDGVEEEYYDNGQLNSKLTYKNGEIINVDFQNSLF